MCHLDPSGGWRHAFTPERPRCPPGSRLVCWQKGHGHSQGLAVEITQRRSPLSQSPVTACARRNAGADCGHSSSPQSVAESLGAQSRKRAAAPSGQSKKKVNSRGLSSRSHLFCRLLACTYSQHGGPNTGVCARSCPCCSKRFTPSARSIPTTTFPCCITASRRCIVASKRWWLHPCWGSRP